MLAPVCLSWLKPKCCRAAAPSQMQSLGCLTTAMHVTGELTAVSCWYSHVQKQWWLAGRLLLRQDAETLGVAAHHQRSHQGQSLPAELASVACLQLCRLLQPCAIPPLLTLHHYHLQGAPTSSVNRANLAPTHTSSDKQTHVNAIRQTCLKVFACEIRR